ncbi:MAG: OmpA family protein [Nitrospiraceae bacterium]
MQKPSIPQIASGGVSPTIVGPHREMQEVYVVSGLVLLLAVGIGAFWYYSQVPEPVAIANSQRLDPAQVSTALKSVGATTASNVIVPSIRVSDFPIATQTAEVLHEDIYFEVGRRGLTDDGKIVLQKQADFLKNEPDWGLLVQGYTDQQGSASYNKILGLKRAENVKQHLITLGVPEQSMKVASLGEEAVICIDNSDLCRRMNRRVHLELRKIGQEHMTLPIVTPAPVAHETIETSPDGTSSTATEVLGADHDGLLNEMEAISKTEPDSESVPTP